MCNFVERLSNHVKMGLWSRIRNKVLFVLSLPATVCFNFRHFPFKQAIKLPVYLFSPRIMGNGSYEISGPVKRGMIRLGCPLVSIYREKGITIENKGKIIFKGSLLIGGDGAISVGEHGTLTLGDKVSNLYRLKVICYHKIDLGNKVRIGWDTLICDTDFHRSKSIEGDKYTQGYGSIKINDEVWVGSFCKIYKNTEIPSRCTVGANTLLNRKIDCEPYSLIYSGGGIKVKRTGYYRDIDDDAIIYPS